MVYKLTPQGNPDGQSYQTPKDLFDKLHAIFRFTVDAAASDVNHLLPKYWTQETDAIKQDWTQETIFCNPPFNNIAPFLVKARTAKFALVFAPLNYLTANGFQSTAADWLVIPKGRINYGAKNNVLLGTCFLIYGSLSEEMKLLGGRIYRLENK